MKENKLLNSSQSIGQTNPRWSTRRNSYFVKWVMLQSGVSAEVIAEYLDVSVGVFQNKLNRNSFSFRELIIIAFACDFSFYIADNNGGNVRRFAVQEELGVTSDDWIRISALKNNVKE